jgi:hypothetical protein
MPVTRSASATTSVAHAPRYSLRANRPAPGHYAEEADEEIVDAARTLLSLRNSSAAAAPAQQPRRSARIASRS